MKLDGRTIGRVISLLILCIVTAAAGGGITFIQKPVGVIYLFLWLLWAGATMLWRKEGVKSTHNKNQLIGLAVLGIITVPALLIGPPWEYANFTGPLPRDGILSWAGLAIFAASIILQSAAMLELKGAYTFRLGIQRGQHLVKSGPYRFVRNPGYFGFILSVIGIGLSLSSIIALLSVVPVVVFILWRIGYEERMLVKEFGKEYRQYMKETKRLIPFIY
ncbi:MAG: isoprenylcysteine carboxylmethyltransferase family protein [Candidatus Micrarchaeota archaeon]|nr:isoprenylcysteine carboxylmethyltransferase family protein [Candidatus Micrarchaeota archaeon]